MHPHTRFLSVFTLSRTVGPSSSSDGLGCYLLETNARRTLVSFPVDIYFFACCAPSVTQADGQPRGFVFTFRGRKKN